MREDTVGGFNRGIVAVGTAAVFIGTMVDNGGAETCPTQCASGKVPLGISAPVNGPPAVFGRPAAKAVEISVRELNAAGGLMGIPVELVVGDDRCDAGMASVVAKRHVEQDKINFVIGSICPAVAMDAAPIYASAGVIQFIPTVTMVELTQRYPDNIFRIAATDQQEAQALATYLAREQKGKRFAVIYSEFFYRRAMAEMIGLALPAEVKALARFEPLQEVPGADDRLADKLKRDPPDVIYMALDANLVVELVGKLRARGVKSLLIGGQHLLSQSFRIEAGKAAEGILVIAPIMIAPVGSLSTSEFRKAADLLRRADVAPDLVALYNYSAVQVWAEAVRLAGSGEPRKVIDALRSAEFTTAVGRIAFDHKGDRRRINFSVLTWRDGHVTELRPVQ